MKKIKKLVDRTTILYLVIGILNFLLCTFIMFLLFNKCGFSAHLAPLVNYGLGSVIWYLSCRYIVFPGHRTNMQQLLRFALEIVVCYLMSYYVIARPCSALLLRSPRMLRLFSFGGQELTSGNCEMTLGAIAYALLNYFGQRFFVFTDRFEYHRKHRSEKKDGGK